MQYKGGLGGVFSGCLVPINKYDPSLFVAQFVPGEQNNSHGLLPSGTRTETCLDFGHTH